MREVRIVAVALAAALVLWLSFDSGIVSREPAPPGTSVSLTVLGVVFGLGAWIMQKGGRPERVPLLVGMSAGLLGYVVLRTLAP